MNIQKTVNSKAVTAKIANELTRLVDGESEPVKLPAERKLAERFGISRRGVRFAIAMLEKKGLIVRKHGSGNYLLPKKLRIENVYIVISEDIKPEDPFYSSLITQFMLYGRENKINLTPVRLNHYSLFNETSPIVLISRIKGELLEQAAERYAANKIIAMFETEDEIENICSVFYDNFYLGSQAAEILALHNHKNVLFLAGTKTKQLSAQKRYQAFLQKAYELRLNVRIMESKMNYAGGYESMKEYLRYMRETHGRNRATAIFASTDWMAAGAYQAIVEEGLSIPRDFSIVGCDDVPLASELIPSLSTFSLDIPNFVEQVFMLIEQSWRVELPARVILKPKFIKRQSLVSLR